ncbi:MAG TPA: BamA/TamA family outer membrane protein [Candidatus Sulfotelmatobacter sp.]|nr:BamA/TamA family outer membrane protein [Candidatus Sulfotelmatobacter sp.]
MSLLVALAALTLGSPASALPASAPPRVDRAFEAGPPASPAPAAAYDSLRAPPIGPADQPLRFEMVPVELTSSNVWLRAPFGDNLLTAPEQWRDERSRAERMKLRFDYNRVDEVRAGLSVELQRPYTMAPRLGAMYEYAFSRDRALYGVQLEQPLLPPGRLALGASITRRTDHSELQQVDNLENTLALLLGRQDYRDYFEREGYGVYLSWRVPDFSTVSLHWRSDEYRSLEKQPSVYSMFARDKELRDNPPIDDGTQHAMLIRLERLARNSYRTRAGLYHWIELADAGGGLGGDFTYTRVLADVRSVLRLSPATTLNLRGVFGTTPSGTLPRQSEFTAGGVDGLRAHSFSQYRGNQMAMAQAEYDVGLWHVRSGWMTGGLHAIGFLDLGRAWQNSDHAWDLSRQHVAVDGGIGFATAEDGLRVYFAKNLQESGSPFVTSFRLQRPF